MHLWYVSQATSHISSMIHSVVKNCQVKGGLQNTHGHVALEGLCTKSMLFVVNTQSSPVPMSSKGAHTLDESLNAVSKDLTSAG